MPYNRGRFGDRDEAYGRLFDAICAAREREFCIRPSDLEVTPTSSNDANRRDHDVVVQMEYCDVHMRMGRIDLWHPFQAKSDFKRFMYANERVLAGGGSGVERQVHVRRVSGELEVGVSEMADPVVDGVAAGILSDMAEGRWDGGRVRSAPGVRSRSPRKESVRDVELDI